MRVLTLQQRYRYRYRQHDTLSKDAAPYERAAAMPASVTAATTDSLEVFEHSGAVVSVRVTLPLCPRDTLLTTEAM